MFSFEITQYEEYSMIGEVFVKNKINLLYGESGIGKTISTIKALNSDGIEPVLLDFDDNLSPKSTNTKFIHIDANKFMDKLYCYADSDFTDKSCAVVLPSDRVIVIDTYHMLSFHLEKFNKIGLNILDVMTMKRNTVIVIGHNLDIASKRDIPDAPSSFVNHCASKLFLSKVKNPESKKYEPTLEVKKLRQYKGETFIYNWMRTEPNSNNN